MPNGVMRLLSIDPNCWALAIDEIMIQDH